MQITSLILAIGVFLSCLISINLLTYIFWTDFYLFKVSKRTTKWLHDERSCCGQQSRKSSCQMSNNNGTSINHDLILLNHDIYKSWLLYDFHCRGLGLWCLMPLSMSVLLVKQTGVRWENHRPVASHWQTLSHNVVLSTPRLSGIWTHNISGDRHRLHW